MGATGILMPVMDGSPLPYTGTVFDGTNHRKLVKHYPTPGVCHELTWSCSGMRHALSHADRRDLVQDAIRRSTERLGFAALAFVVMTNHVHLLVRPRLPEYDLPGLLYAIKKPSSFQVKQLMRFQQDPDLDSFMVVERPGKTVFRLWQEGPGYDRNLGQDTLNASVRYIHLNPVRRGLCARAVEWRWSSAAWYQRELIRPDGGIDWPALDDTGGAPRAE